MSELTLATDIVQTVWLILLTIVALIVMDVR